MDEPVVVCGATGTVGSRLVARLVERGVQVRGVARHPGHYSGPQGVELREADLREADQAEKALRGAHTVYLTPPERGRHPLDNEISVSRHVIEAARNEGVKHLVVHTALEAKQGNTGVRIIDNKQEVEHLVKESGVPFTILRPGWFMQNLASSRDEIERGVLRMPLPPGCTFGAVSAADVAEVALRFMEKGPQGRGFDLHVKDGTSPEEIAEAASRVVGKPVRYEETSAEEFLERQGLDGPQRELTKEFFAHVRDAEFIGNPQDITNALVGFQFTSTSEYLRRMLSQGTGSVAIQSSSGMEPHDMMHHMPEPGALPPDGRAPSPMPPPGPGPPDPHFRRF